MRVGELRKLLEGLNPDMVVMVRGDGLERCIQGVFSAGPDAGCGEIEDFCLELADEPDETVVCAICGGVAACIGAYEGATVEQPACDSCCAHGNEDGHCRPIDPAEHPPNVPPPTPDTSKEG